MSAEEVSPVDDVAPGSEETQEGPGDRRGTGIWALLAVGLLVAIVLLLLLARCVPRVPNVVGLTERQAVTELEGAGYAVGTVSVVAMPDSPAGKVAEQAPAAGTVLSRGRSVDILVALGADMVEVPYVVGMDTPAADLLITRRKLIMRVDGLYSSTIPAGAIISQNPTAGTKVRVGSTVIVVVSLGLEPPTGTGTFSSGASGVSAGGSGSAGSGSTESNCTASYPNATVWASGGDIYIRLTSGAGARQLTSGGAWDSTPLLSPNAKYVVFMRAPTSGGKSDGIGRVCLTDFSVAMMKMPWSSQMTTGRVWYQDYAFAPSTTGTAPGSDWLVISQLYEYPLTSAQHPDPAQNVRGRLAVCNVPIASSWVAWNEAFFPTAGITLSGSSQAGCVKVSAVRPDGALWVRNFNAHTGRFLK